VLDVDALGSQPPALVDLFPGSQATVMHDDPPPGQPLSGGHDAADGPRRPGETGLGGHIAVAHDFAELKPTDDAFDGAAKSRFGGTLSRHGGEPTEAGAERRLAPSWQSSMWRDTWPS
jgi:hypothetical protein